MQLVEDENSFLDVAFLKLLDLLIAVIQTSMK